MLPVLLWTLQLPLAVLSLMSTIKTFPHLYLGAIKSSFHSLGDSLIKVKGWAGAMVHLLECKHEDLEFGFTRTDADSWALWPMVITTGLGVGGRERGSEAPWAAVLAESVSRFRFSERLCLRKQRWRTTKKYYRH